MNTGRHDEIRYTSLSKMRDSQLGYIIHLATETGNCAWQMNKRSIIRDLLWHIYKSETSNEVWISDTPPPLQDDHIDRITDCSTRYSQAPAVALAWDWPREDAFTLTIALDYYQLLCSFSRLSRHFRLRVAVYEWPWWMCTVAILLLRR